MRTWFIAQVVCIGTWFVVKGYLSWKRLFVLEPCLLLKVVCIGTGFIVKGCLYWNLVYC